MKKITFEQFQKEWKESMVYRETQFDDFGQFMQDQYVHYKSDELGFTFNQIYNVKEFCDFFYMDADLDTHPYMIKEKALNSKHVKGLIDLANKKFHL